MNAFALLLFFLAYVPFKLLLVIAGIEFDKRQWEKRGTVR